MISDEALMLDFQKGAREAFEELFARYRQPLYGFFRRRLASRERAEDLTQEIFLVVMRATSRYEPRSLVRTYLYGIALKLLAAEGRKQERNAVSADLDRVAVANDTPDEMLWVLSNARNTERRLTDLLRQRTGKLADILAVEKEIDSVRGEIERMEAEKKNLASRVYFATLNIKVMEDYKAQLQVVPGSTLTRFRNAAVEGYQSMVEGLVSVLLFLFTYGPSLLISGTRSCFFRPVASGEDSTGT